MTAQLSRERLEQKLLEHIKHGGDSEEETIIRMLLAAMDSEPVGEVVLGDYDDCGDYPDAKFVCIAAQGQADWNNFRNGTKLYAAPPAPGSKFIEHIRKVSTEVDSWPEWKRNILSEKPAPVVVPVPVPDELKRAVEFYEQVKRENTPVETGAWKDAVDWVLKEACRAAYPGSA